MNHDIASPTIRVINEQGENVGILSKDEALQLAVQQGLDLIQINAQVDPPIAKIISFDKFRYQQEKEEKRQLAQHRSVAEMKQVRISVRAAENDLKIKAAKIDEFLSKGHKVEIMLALRGREKYNREWIALRLEQFLAMIATDYKITSPQKQGGRGITIQIANK